MGGGRSKRNLSSEPQVNDERATSWTCHRVIFVRNTVFQKLTILEFQTDVSLNVE